MIEGLFAEDGDDDYCVLTAEQGKGENLAGDLIPPPASRGQSNFVGLLNQGATCYLNSLFQALFMTPELRSAVFSLPLYLESISEESDWLPPGDKRNILSALQELFVKLAFVDERTISTANLTKSFGWSGEEVVVQHDVQELSRVFFDCLDRVFEGTEHSDLISKYLKGKIVNITMCKVCGAASEREEIFGDIGLRVKGLRNIEESFSDFFKEESLDGNNQYWCESCGVKVDAMRMTRLVKVPPLLFLGLNRFEYDTKTYERVKITSNFEYQLEIDMGKYLEGAGVYELFAVIIHGGSAHSGHYHAYIRDLLEEGVWEPLGQPVVTEKEPEKNNSEAKAKPNKGNKTKKGRRRGKNKKKQPEPVKVEDNSYEYQDLESNCADRNLLKNWFDFNDSAITAIKSGKLKKQFGSSNESAYMLLYRSKDMPAVKKPELPEYWKKAITSLNDDYRNQRLKYEEEKKYIEVQVQLYELFDISQGVLLYKNQDIMGIQQGIPIRIKLSDSIEDLKNQLTVNLIEDIPDLFDSYQIYIGQSLSNKSVHILKPLDSLENSSYISSSIFHKSLILLFPLHNPELESILNFTGELCEPISITCNFCGDKFSLYVNKAWSVSKLKSAIHEKLGIPIEDLELKMRKAEGGEKKLTYKDDDSLLHELKFYHSIPISISAKDREIPMVELTKNEQGEGLITVLLFDEKAPDKALQHLINPNWKVSDLIVECKRVFEIEEGVSVRLRKLVDKKVVYKEDRDNFLKNIPEFNEGGYRFQVERGEPPAFGLIVVKVALRGDDEPKELFVKETERISDVKDKAAEVLGFEATNYKLYRTDWLKEPIAALKQENQTLYKAAVKDGDLLLVKSMETVLEAEMKKVNCFVTNGEKPNDVRFVVEVSVPEDTTLEKFKEVIKDNPELNPQNYSYFRIRELTKTLWPGKVYKEEKKSLKKLSISFGANLLIDPLSEEDKTSFTGTLLYVCERDSARRLIFNICLAVFDAGSSPTIDHLYEFVLKVLGKDWLLQDITLGRYKAQSFEWEILKDSRSAEMKGNLKNAKANTTGQGINNLKKAPYFLKDGDMIAVKHDLAECAADDTFVCDDDATARAEYFNRSQANKKQKRPPKPEKAIKIGDF